MSYLAVFAYIVLGLISLLIFFWWQRATYWQKRGIPCEPPVFFFGNMSGVQKTKTFKEIFSQHYRKFKGSGPFAGFYWFQSLAVLVLEPFLIKNILIKDFAKFSDRGLYYNDKDDPLSADLVHLQGEKWKIMRHKTSPTFTSGKMKFMFPTVVNVGNELVTLLTEMIRKNPIVDMKDLSSRFTMDVVGSCAFGIDCNSLKDPKAEFKIMGEKALVDERHNQFILILMVSFPELAKKLGMKITAPHIEKFFMKVVRETVSYREKNNVKRNDFLDLLIDLKNSGDSDKGGLQSRLSIDEIAAQVFVFLVAGFETSSLTMSFALYELAKNPGIQEKARKEIIAAFEKYGNDFTYECMKEMKYLDQILSETLRMYTVFPILFRKAEEDYTVPGYPNYVIKKGMMVLIPAADIHSDSDYYSNPEVFNPDNFSPDQVKSRDSILNLSFGEGPRNCIGMRFGKMQSLIGLALLLKSFKFTLSHKTEIPIDFDKESVLVRPKNSLLLKVENI